MPDPTPLTPEAAQALAARVWERQAPSTRWLEGPPHQEGARMPEPMPPRNLTPDEYAATGGMCCPTCGGTTLFPGGFTRRGMIAVTQHGRCAHCGAAWTAVYALTGYEGLTQPQEGSPSCRCCA